MSNKGFRNQAKSGQQAVPARLKRIKVKVKAQAKTTMPATKSKTRRGT